MKICVEDNHFAALGDHAVASMLLEKLTITFLTYINESDNDDDD